MFCDRLREERKRLGLTQTEFAKAVGIHLNTQSRYEKGKTEPDNSYLDAIGGIGVDVAYVMGHSPYAPKEKLEDFLHAWKVGGAGVAERDIFGSDVPGLEAQFGGGDGIGSFLLSVLGVEHEDWNRILENLVKIDPDGTPGINSSDPRWFDEISKASKRIVGLVEAAATLDSELLAGIFEGLDRVLDDQSVPMARGKKSKIVSMLYRSFKVSGKIDPAMIEEVVKLASS